jgi:hypothetical protein
MTNDVAKKQAAEVDSIDSFDDAVASGDDGDGRRGGGFLPEGMVIKYTNAQQWENKNGEIITDKVVIHLDTIRTVVEWGNDGKPVASPRILGPGEQYPDVEAMNEKIPKDRWRPGYKEGELRGPMANQNVMVFGNLATMERYVWPSETTTIGSSLAVRELTGQVKRMRKFRGARVFAKIKFSKCPFPTGYGLRQRPHLKLLGWVESTEHGLVQIDPQHLLPGLQQVAASKAQPDPAPGAREVTEPSLSEEMGDKVKF